MARYTFNKNGASYGLLMEEIQNAGLPLDQDRPFTDTKADDASENLSVGFTSALDAGEQTTLAAVIAAHAPDEALSGMRLGFSYYPAEKLTINNSWRVFSSFLWAGTDYFGKDPKRAQVVAELTQGNNPYSIRFYDVTNNQVLCEKSGLTNSDPTIHDLGTLSNFPVADAIVEIQLKRDSGNGSTKVSVDAAQVLF